MRTRSGVSLPNFNATNVWAAPDTTINSTSAFISASHLEAEAYIANKWFFIALMIILGLFIVVQIPYTCSRMCNSPAWWYGARLVRSRKPHPVMIPRKPSPRLRHYHLPLPPRIVHFVNLTLGEAMVVLLLWTVGVGIAGWCQSAFLTQASRSTLVIMALATFTAALGVKSGGVGTWVVKGYTAVNFLHRWAGRLVLLLATLHVVAYLVIFYRAGIAKLEMSKPENYLGAVGYGGLCLTGLVSVGYVRRRWWLLFKFGHHLGILLLLAGLNYHSPDVIPYLLAIWALILINITLRAITTRYEVVRLLPLPDAQSTLMIVPNLTRGFIPGQHVRIRLFSLGWRNMLESHPFTIASGNEEEIRLIIKVAGNWTKSVYALAEGQDRAQVEDKDQIAGIRVRCSIEGPYGGPSNFAFNQFSSVLLVVGGSGITFGMGVVRGLLSDIKHRRSRVASITLVWAVPNRANLEALSDQFNEIHAIASCVAENPQLRLNLLLHYTRPSTSSLPADGTKKPIIEMSSTHYHLRITQGRPDSVDILRNLVQQTVSGGVGVGACGPEAMVLSIERAVYSLDKMGKKRAGGVEIYTERFSL